ncbi:MAG TPA: cysteine--tRNA ligase [Candidatus Nanoarchaeia archaeon]|nr:cysteine--tRNA ligase [Candidatus Nanoarchaeia archaeon]
MLKFHNTLTNKLQSFKPLTPKKINLYVCGPTTYDYSHIGHAKSYIQFDVIVRYLRTKYDVFYVQNITDIDDKIINRANAEKKDWETLARTFEKEYLDDMKTLNVTSVSKQVRATEHISEMIDQIKRLQKKDIAYEINDGVYFDISKFKEYGKLSKQKLDELKQHRIEPNQQKRNAGDFSLWKKAKPNEPFWNSPWGKGRPGWHIECSAMGEKHLGQTYDIHGGGIDLIFPHHEAEIAQMESITNKTFAQYWLHNGFLLINNEKMSKSLNNFITIRGAMAKWSPMAVRFLFATSHYRSPINFTETSMANARSSFEKLQNTVREAQRKFNELSLSKPDKADAELIKKVKDLKKQFTASMNNDFDTPNAAAAVFELSHLINKYNGTKQTLKKMLDIFTELTDILGFIFKTASEIPKFIDDAVAERKRARMSKDWKRSDILRTEIEERGYAVDDTPSGPVVRKL